MFEVIHKTCGSQGLFKSREQANAEAARLNHGEPSPVAWVDDSDQRALLADLGLGRIEIYPEFGPDGNS